MATLLLIIIYLAFISLGLPDSVFGVAWPLIRSEFNLSLEYGGYVSFILTIGTISSSLLSGYIINWLKTGKVIVLSVLLTVIGLLGFYLSPSFIWILLLAFPLGFGAGSIDTALNHYVSVNYKSHHMNWLHAFWGVGATSGPIIMSFFFVNDTWRKGYLAIAIIQLVFLVILTASLPLWKHNHKPILDIPIKKEKRNVFKIKGVSYALLIFLSYCALEFTFGIWGSSYLIEVKEVIPSIAARIVALYFGGIMIGRFLSGVLSFKLSNKKLIYFGIILVFIGTTLLLFASSIEMITLSFIIVGTGLAPIFPSMIHETPRNFGKENSQYIIGYQIAFAYLGTALFPPLLGFLASRFSITIFPLYTFILAFLLLISVNSLYIKVKKI